MPAFPRNDSPLSTELNRINIQKTFVVEHGHADANVDSDETGLVAESDLRRIRMATTRGYA